MYNHLTFASVREHRSTDLQELVGLAKEKFHYDSQIVDISSLTITDKGTLLFQGQERIMLRPAFIQLCKRLKIPDPFAKHIPWGLLKHNITTLSMAYDIQVRVFTRDDDTIVNVANGSFIPLGHSAFIESMQDKLPNITRGVISDITLELDSVEPIFGEKGKYPDIKPRKGDVIKTGLRFKNSMTGFNFTSAALLLWRLICLNGMTLPVKLGFAKMRTKPDRELSVSLNHFLSQVDNLGLQANSVEKALKGLNRPLNSLEFARYWKGLDKIVRDRDYLDTEIFVVDTEERQEFLSDGRMAKKFPDRTPMDTGVNGYELVNNVTDRAKTFDQTIRLRLEEFAGKIVSNQMPLGDLAEA